MAQTKMKRYMVSKRSRDCSTLAKAATTISRAWRGRKSRKATRVAGASQAKNKVDMSPIIETKLQPLRNVRMGPPTAQSVLPASGPVYYSNYILGDTPAAWQDPNGSANYSNLDGYRFIQGTGANQRIGKYMFLKQARLDMTIALQAVSSRNPEPLQFRVLCYKFKRNKSLGSIGNPNTDLFISSSGGFIGVNTFFDNTNSPGAASFDLMNAIPNRKNYDVYNDEKFILQPTLTIAQGGEYVTPAQDYPVQKHLSFKCLHNSKTEFDLTTSKPIDLQYQYCFTILSAPQGSMSKVGVNQWTTSIRGTVSALDS